MSRANYYAEFEKTIRGAAERYFRRTERNYFSDLILAHSLVGLTFVHKQAALIFPLCPTKNYDVIVISEEFNDGLVQLLYALKKSINEMKRRSNKNVYRRYLNKRC